MELNDELVLGQPRDAASVVLLSDDAGRLEVFLLRRGESSTVVGNAHVFPGGKVDDRDAEPSAWPDAPPELAASLGEPELESSRARALVVAACRETREETTVVLAPSALVPLSRWITPKRPALMKKRFDTRFFVARSPAGANARHDGQEATHSVWLEPRRALFAYRDGDIVLAPPQIMTLAMLARMPTVETVLANLRAVTPPLVEPVAFLLDGERAVAYPGDPEHPDPRRALSGPTRLVLRDGRFVPPDGFDAFFRD